MSKSYATMLKKLCNDHMNHKISFDDYRRKRKTLLAKIDEQFNGRKDEPLDELTSPGLARGQFSVGSQNITDK